MAERLQERAARAEEAVEQLTAQLAALTRPPPHGRRRSPAAEAVVVHNAELATQLLSLRRRLAAVDGSRCPPTRP